MESLRDDAGRSQGEYRRLYEAFVRLLDWWENSAERWDVVEDIITLRTSFLIDRAITGLAIDFDKALDLLRNHNDHKTEQERQQRDILVAAIDNLVDFAAAQQNVMMDELPEQLDEDHYEEYDDVFERYYLRQGAQENSDVLFSAAMAAWWIGVATDTLLTYTTQGDERVRPWHESLEGISYPKSEFPPELIPPIEYGCRCFLVADGHSSVIASLDGKDYITMVHPVFRESLATSGRIFSGEHPYFKKPLHPRIKAIAENVKQKLYLHENNI